MAYRPLPGLSAAIPAGYGAYAVLGQMKAAGIEAKLMQLPPETRREALQVYDAIRSAARGAVHDAESSYDPFPVPGSIEPDIAPVELGEVLTVAQASAALGLTPARVRQLCESGELGGDKPKGRWQVSAASVRARRELQEHQRAA